MHPFDMKLVVPHKMWLQITGSPLVELSYAYIKAFTMCTFQMLEQ